MSTFLSTVFLGGVVGSIYSLYAIGLVLTYRVSGVFNFAQGALGMFFAFVYYQLVQGGRLNFVLFHYSQRFRVPFWLALPLVVIVLAPGVGWLADAILFRGLRRAGSIVQIVATIGLLISLLFAATLVWTKTLLSPRDLIGGGHIQLGGFSADAQEIGSILLVGALCAGLLGFLRFSSLGIRMRAVVDRAEVAEIMGVDSGQVSGLAWAMAAGFAALAGILVAPFFGTLDPAILSLLVVIATAAALIGRLESIPYTLAGAMVIGIGQHLVQQYAHGVRAAQFRPAIPFIALFGVLLLPVNWPQPSIAASPSVPLPRRIHGRRVRLTRLGVLGAVAGLAPFVLRAPLHKLLGPAWGRQLALVPGMALIFLSLVVLTGLGGQVSLCQAALAGFAGFTSAHLVNGEHLPFLLAAVMGAISVVPIGAVLAWRATRLPALFLGLATLAFGAFMDDYTFTDPHFANGVSGIRVPRPHGFASDRGYYLLALGVFALGALAVTNLRRGRNGLALTAMRDSQRGLASLGASVARLRFVSFCLSAFLAGLGGALFAGARGLAIRNDFVTLQSLVILAVAVVGGIHAWPGALLGAAILELAPAILHQPFFSRNYAINLVFHRQLETLLPVFFGLGAIGLARNPFGIVEQIGEGLAALGARLRAPAVATAQLVDAPRQPVPPSTQPVTFARARLYHLPGCALAAGKRPLPLTQARARTRSPCPVCAPPRRAQRANR